MKAIFISFILTAIFLFLFFALVVNSKTDRYDLEHEAILNIKKTELGQEFTIRGVSYLITEEFNIPNYAIVKKIDGKPICLFVNLKECVSMEKKK